MIILPALMWAWSSSPLGGNGDPVAVEEPEGAAPDFTLELMDGSTFSLERHLKEDGRPLIMNFWASWCVPCRKEMPALDAVAMRHSDVLLLGVAVQDREEDARQFADEVAVSYPLGLDTGNAILDAYPTIGLPTSWFITGDGVVAAKVPGQLDESRIEDLAERYLVPG